MYSSEPTSQYSTIAGRALLALSLFVLLFAGSVKAANSGQNPEKLPTPDERLDRTFDLVFSDPAMAGIEIQAMAKRYPKYTNPQKAKYHNLKAVYLAVTGKEDLAEKSFLASLKFSSPSDPARANTLNNLAVIQKNKGDFSKALDYLDQSKAFFQENNDVEGLARNYTERASVYKLMGLTSISLDHLLEAVELLENAPKSDERILLSTRQRLANTYLDAGDYSFALKLYNEVLPKFLIDENRLDYAATLLNRAECLIQMKKHEDALVDVRKALPMIQKFGNKDLVSLAKFHLGNIYAVISPLKAEAAYHEGFEAALTGDGIYGTALAIEYADLLMHSGQIKECQKVMVQWERKRPINKEEGVLQARWLALTGELAARKGESIKAQSYFQRSYDLRDSLYDTKLVEQSRNLQEKFKSDLLQEENDQMASDLRWNRVVAVLAVVLAFAIAGIGVYSVYVGRLKAKLRAVELNRLEQEAQMLSENVQLKEDIITQQKSQLISSALETSQWMEKFQNLAAKADRMGIQSLRDDIESAAAQDKHWTVFIERFRQLNPNFMETLSARFPELTKGELEFCSMARMNLSFKEIAHLLNISHQSVHMKKYRITKKMNLEADDDFYSLLRSM